MAVEAKRFRMFGAIRLERSHPEFLNYVPSQKAMINTMINGMKQKGTGEIRTMPTKK